MCLRGRYIGSVPTTPDPNNFEKYHDTNGRHIVIQIGCVYTTFCLKEGMLWPKYRDRNGRCIAILFKSIGVGWILLNKTLREAKPGGFQTRVFPTFFGKGPDCVAEPFGTVPRRCS